MRVVVQRVSSASVEVETQQYKAQIGLGMLILCAFIEGDTETDLQWMAKKLAALRIFDDEAGVMNLSVMDRGLEMLAVSQFTLYACTARGNRPSYIRAAKPEISVPLYERFVELLRSETGLAVPTGIFGADMKVSLVNDGPVTIIMDSKTRDI